MSTSDGVPLHVEIHGWHGPLVVLSHGFTATSVEWSRQVADLAGRARLVVWDQRGHGRSGWGDPARATVDQLGRDLATVVEAVAPRERIVLAGHSMGGMTILALAHRHPEWFGTRVGGVLLVATSAGDLVHEGVAGMLHHGARWLGLLPPVLAAGRWLAPYADGLPWRGSWLGRRLLRRLLFTAEAGADEVREAQRISESLPLAVATAFWGALLDFDGTASVPALRRVPTTVVVAEDDRLTPAADGRAIGAALGPDAVVVSVPHAAHAVPRTHPEPVDAALADLLDGLTASGREAGEPGKC